jgi:MFS family permease
LDSAEDTVKRPRWAPGLQPGWDNHGVSDGSKSWRSWREVWAKRLLVAICAIVFLIGVGFLGAAFLPRWWAHRVGGQVNGSIGAGVALGLFYGFVFTAIPLAVLRYAFDKRRAWSTWGILFAIAILFAVPNLLTLGVVLGSGNASHAGERTLDVEAPAYRSAALAGAILALLAFALLHYLLVARRRSRREVERLREELKASKQESASAPSSQPPVGLPPGPDSGQ